MTLNLRGAPLNYDLDVSIPQREDGSYIFPIDSMWCTKQLTSPIDEFMAGQSRLSTTTPWEPIIRFTLLVALFTYLLTIASGFWWWLCAGVMLFMSVSFLLGFVLPRLRTSQTAVPAPAPPTTLAPQTDDPVIDTQPDRPADELTPTHTQLEPVPAVLGAQDLQQLPIKYRLLVLLIQRFGIGKASMVVLFFLLFLLGLGFLPFMLNPPPENTLYIAPSESLYNPHLYKYGKVNPNGRSPDPDLLRSGYNFWLDNIDSYLNPLPPHLRTPLPNVDGEFCALSPDFLSPDTPYEEVVSGTAVLYCIP